MWFLFSWLFYLLWWGFLLILFLLALIIGAVWWCQGALLYLPSFGGPPSSRTCASNPSGFRNPSEQHMTYQEHYITCKDGVKIHAWMCLHPSRPTCPTIIFFHGNAGNIGLRIPNARSLCHLTNSNVLLVEYRGYGSSGGFPSERGLQLDAQAALDHVWAQPDIAHDKIFLFGRSLGGAVALHCAHHNQDKLAGVIVENTFTNIDDMVVVLAARLGVVRGVSFLRFFLRYFMTSHWYSSHVIRSIRTPLLFMSGLDDELVPPQQMRELYETATQCTKKSMHQVPGGEHNDTHIKGGHPYYHAFAQFVSQHQAPSSQPSQQSSSTSQTATNTNQ